MNRRSFFRSLSSAVAGVYAACHVNLSRVKESVAAAVANKEWVINPEWANAPYEFVWCSSLGNEGRAYTHLWQREKETKPLNGLDLNGQCPTRYDKSFTMVPPLIQV